MKADRLISVVKASTRLVQIERDDALSECDRLRGEVSRLTRERDEWEAKRANPSTGS